MVVALAVALLTGARVTAQETLTEVGRSIPSSTVLRLELRGLDHLEQHPLVTRLLKWAGETQLLQGVRNQPKLLAANDALRFIESHLDVSSRQLLMGMTRHGLAAAILPGDPQRILLVAHAENEDLPKGLLAAIDDLATQAGAPLPHSLEGDVPVRHLGPIWVAQVGDRLVVTSDRESLRNVLESIRRAVHTEPAPEHFQARLTVDLNVIRAAPDSQEGLKFPATDVGAVAILGGWADLLRNFDLLQVDLNTPAADVRLRARVAIPRGPQVSPGLEGFWASKDEGLAPILNPPGTIYSASWYRDYASLWDAREKLLTPETVAMLNKADADAGQQMQVVGAAFTPSQLFSQLGPHYRVALIEGAAPYSEVNPPNILPAGVAVIELKDEALVKEWSGPVLRIFNLILNGDQGIISTTEQHGADRLTILSLPTSRQAQRKGSLDRYNFRTTYTFSDGHFVIGTTPAAVKAVLDDMRSPSRTDPSVEELNTTERQVFEADRLVSVMESVQEALGRNLVLGGGLSFADAEREIARLHTLIDQLGTLKTEAGWTESGFEYRVDWTFPRGRD
jgi:hypothetical protein